MLIKLITSGVLAFGMNAQALTLNDYLDQVEKQSLNYQEGLERARGQELTAREADLLTSPQFFITGRRAFDGKLPNPPIYSYDQIKTENYSVGLSQQFDFGVEAKFSYDFNKTSLETDGAPGGLVSEYSIWEIAPKLEVTVPLWGNRFGKTLKANKEVIKKQSLAGSYGALAQSQGFIVEAEVAYWRLAAAQENVKILEQALKAARNIHSYVEEKRRKNLGDDADVFQADALVESYKLQIQEALNEEKSAGRSFNTFLNISADSVVPKLGGIDYSNLDKIIIPEVRPGERYDVAAAKAQAELAKASSTLIEERNKPVLNLTGGYILNGQDTEFNRSFKESRKNDRDAGYIGLAFQVPLNYFARNDAKEGAQRLVRAAELNVQFKDYQQDQDWYEIQQKLTELKSTLKLNRTMENAQKKKLENERHRLRQGRTTTYQVLLFEQDYSLAQVSRVRSALQILALNSQMKLYNLSQGNE